MFRKYYFKVVIAALIIVLASLLARFSMAGMDDRATTVAWGYTGKTGPSFWGQLDSSFATCANGKMQSPIDITGYLAAKKNSLQFNYHLSPLNIVYDGLTQLDFNHHQEVINDGHTIQVNFPAQGPEEIISYQGKNYRLIQFHIHAPSENLYDGVAYPLEIHFVHQGDGNLAVVGVFVVPGKPNPTLQTIIDHLPTTKGKVMTLDNVNIQPSGLIPDNISYYRFDGSLTTPPCTEGVKWIVMRNSITASSEQINQLKAAIGQANARPVQPLNQRKIEFIKH